MLKISRFVPLKCSVAWTTKTQNLVTSKKIANPEIFLCYADRCWSYCWINFCFKYYKYNLKSFCTSRRSPSHHHRTYSAKLIQASLTYSLFCFGCICRSTTDIASSIIQGYPTTECFQRPASEVSLMMFFFGGFLYYFEACLVNLELH